MYYLLKRPTEHFICSDPQKFFEKLREISEKEDLKYENTCKYFLHDHIFCYLYHEDKRKDPALVFEGEEHFMQYAENMTELLKQEVGNKAFKEVEKLATKTYNTLKDEL